jgi:hypothetical protein
MFRYPKKRHIFAILSWGHSEVAFFRIIFAGIALGIVGRLERVMLVDRRSRLCGDHILCLRFDGLGLLRRLAITSHAVK